MSHDRVSRGVYPLLREISLVLARRPPLIADSHGWVEVEALCAALREKAPRYSNFGSADLAEFHSELKTARGRFDLQGDRVRIRYAQNFHGVPRQPPLDEIPRDPLPLGRKGRVAATPRCRAEGSTRLNASSRNIRR